MSGSAYRDLAEVLEDDRFPKIDLDLRRGRHIGREDGDDYTFLMDALKQLEPFYLRFRCQLVSKTDGYVYLLPMGGALPRRTLSVGEMLVGQTLALMCLDPATLNRKKVVTREALLQRLEGLVGAKKLIRALNPRLKKRIDERVGAEKVRRKVQEALRNLHKLGFIELERDRFTLRNSLLRFSEPVRDLDDREAALKRLMNAGEVQTRNLPGLSRPATESAKASG